MMLQSALLLSVLTASLACGRAQTQAAGHFEVRSVTQGSFGHCLTRVSLACKDRRLVESVADWAVAPDNPDRVVYTTQSYGDPTSPCGTYFYDGIANQTIRVASEPMSLDVGWAAGGSSRSSPWQPNGRFIILDTTNEDVSWSAVPPSSPQPPRPVGTCPR